MTAQVDVIGPRAVPGHPPTGPSGGPFHFAPRTTGTYRLVSIEARGYASFEGEFGSSPVSFTSTEGNDISGVVLRLTPEEKARPRRRGRRSGSDQVERRRHRFGSAGIAARPRLRRPHRSGRPLHPRAGPARRDEPVRAEGGLPHGIVTLGPVPEEGEYPPIAIGLTPRASDDDASVEMTGIGAVLQARREWAAVVDVVAGRGATDAGLASGDQILALDGTPVGRLGYERAIGVIRGPEGTTVVLRVRRDGRESDVVVTRKRVRH